MMAIDTSPESHALARAWVAEPKDAERHTARAITTRGAAPATPAPTGRRRAHPAPAPIPRPLESSADGRARIAVFAPLDALDVDRNPFRAQMELPVPREQLPEHFVRAMRTWRGWMGLRHWIAFLCSFTDAGRTGVLRWTMREHLDVLGYSAAVRHDREKQREIAAEIECFARVEFALYGEGGKLRVSRPLLHVQERQERRQKDGEPYVLDGMHITVNPALYEGVGSVKGFGRRWFPGCEGLAKVSHVTTPHALPLGLILPMRWRWRWQETHGAESSVRLCGLDVLELAGITVGRDRARAMARLRATLDTLVLIGALGSYQWHGPAWTLDARVELVMPDAARRILAGEDVPPTGPGLSSVPLTGAELRAWRESLNLTGATLATATGVSRKTIVRAEASAKLSAGFRRKLLAFQQSRRAAEAWRAP